MALPRIITASLMFLALASLGLPGCGGDTPTGPDVTAPQVGTPTTPAQPPSPSLPAPGGIANVEIAPGSVIGSGSVQGTVRLVSVRTADLIVQLSSSDAAADVPGTVTVAAGSLTTGFRIATRSVNEDLTVTITAAAAGHAVTAPLRVVALKVTELKLERTDVGGSFPLTATVEVDARVGVDGPPITVELSTSDSAVTVPASVRVADDQAAATFTIQTRNVSSPRTVTITARTGSHTRTREINLWPVFLSFAGQRGDFVTQGQSHRFDPVGGRRFVGIFRNSRLYIETTGPGGNIADNWNLFFSAGAGKPLQRGRYVKDGDVDLQFTGQGRICSASGEFEVLDAEFEDDGDIVRFHATFRHRCTSGGSAAGPTTGEVWVASLPAPGR